MGRTDLDGTEHVSNTRTEATTMDDHIIDIANPVDLRLGAGTTVEVHSGFDQRWTRGFTVVDVTDAGYLLRRQSDGSVLPAWFPLEQVRPLPRSA
ncbi:MAG TPA: hypothetical protein PLS63_10125 [Microthrixaceae bacterium]|nr:hypothetical protein [Microthrixaceae bacterium]